MRMAACSRASRRPRDAASSDLMAAIRRADRVHGLLAAVGLDDGDGGVEAALLAEPDRLCQLGELGVGRRGECPHLFVAAGVASGERAEAIDGGGDDGM